MCFPVDLPRAATVYANLTAGRSRSRRPRHGVLSGRTGFVSLLVLATSMSFPSVVRAQDNTNGTSATSDVTQLIQDMDDIDNMRPLIPLKLTPEQMDKMIAVISSEQAGYDKKLKALAGPTLAKLADQIHDVKQRSIKGEPIPKDFDVVVKQAETEILGKRKTLDAETIATIANGLQDTLTPEQVKLAAKLDKDAQTKLGKVTANTQRTETQWFVSYVRDAIFTSPRVLIVLKQMRAAANTKTASSGAGGGK